MKKTTITLIVLMGMLATGCTKDTFVEANTSATEVSGTYNLTYSINGTVHNVSFRTEGEYKAFLQYLMRLARENGEVRLTSRGSFTGLTLTKEKLTFTTKSIEEASAWAAEKLELGYDVTVEYNEETGIYTCIAIK